MSGYSQSRCKLSLILNTTLPANIKLKYYYIQFYLRNMVFSKCVPLDCLDWHLHVKIEQIPYLILSWCLQAVVGFRLDGKMVSPAFEFDSEEIQYSHRFYPFNNVSTPPCIPYSQYRVIFIFMCSGSYNKKMYI